MSISKYQKFISKTIHRSLIKNAPYNPRKIGENEAKELRKALKKYGLVESLVWNEKTGNLVGGHQRLSQLDLLEKNNDYELTVSVINVDDKTEKEINIILNNPNLQGDYDNDALSKLIGEINFKDVGFSQYDIDIMGIDIDLKGLEEKEVQGTSSIKNNIDAIKESKKATKEKSRTQKETYLVATFSSVEQKEVLLNLLGQEIDDRYIKGETLIKLLK